MRNVLPIGSVSPRGSTTPFASARRHHSSASPACRAASRSRRSPSSTRTPRLTRARIGLSATSNASSVTETSVTRTGTTRCLLQTNSASGASSGSTSSTPAFASASFACRSSARGCTSSSSAASCGWIPTATAVGLEAGSSRNSVASISASSLIVSIAAPFSRSACERSPVSPVACTCSVRVSESGLYCSAITRRTRPESGSICTIPPLMSRGERVIGRASLRQVLVEECVDVRPQRLQRVRRRDVERVRLGERLLEVRLAVRGHGLAAVLLHRIAELVALHLRPDDVLELAARLLDRLRAGGRPRLRERRLGIRLRLERRLDVLLLRAAERVAEPVLVPRVRVLRLQGVDRRVRLVLVGTRLAQRREVDRMADLVDDRARRSLGCRRAGALEA